MGTVLPLLFTAGWASGINPYLFTLLTIVLGRLDWISVPAALERTDVLVVTVILTVADTIVGKIAVLDSVWDAINTIVRPLAGAALAVLIAQPDSTLAAATVAGAGGTVALITHLAKSSVRLSVNASPEPVSNIVVSLIEDLVVVTVVLIAVLNPYLAAAAALIVLVWMITAAIVLGLGIRHLRHARQLRRNGPTTPVNKGAPASPASGTPTHEDDAGA